jgi:hypothetical protein
MLYGSVFYCKEENLLIIRSFESVDLNEAGEAEQLIQARGYVTRGPY